MAGLTTKTNKVGTIGAFPFPVIKGSMNAYEKAAKAMIEAGVDVIMTTANQVRIGSIQACKEAGVKAVGFIADQHAIAPGTVVGSVLFYTPQFFTAIVDDYLKGNLQPQVKTYGWKEKFSAI